MKRLPFTYSAFLIICCLLVGALGCGRQQPAPEESDARAALALEDAMTRFGVSKSVEEKNYLYYMSARLNAGLARVGKRCEGCDFTLLSTKEPLAYSPGAKHIVISKGLLEKLNNEAELAFVLAHELAHQVLGHHQQVQQGSAGAEPQLREEFEKEADRFAVGLIAVAGYDPHLAPSALMHAYGKVTPDGNAVGYPELYARERLIVDEVENSGWIPPGTVDRREFQKIRRGVR